MSDNTSVNTSANSSNSRSIKRPASRREFLRASAAGASVGAVASLLGTTVHGAYTAGNDEIRVGLIGCGGRGSGAAVDALSADPKARLVAMGDAFADRLQASHQNLSESEVGKQVDVAQDRMFVGFDAYQKVIDAGVDVVLLTAPPCFRPMHMRAAIAAGKHMFVEKPVAVDAPGVRAVMDLCREAKAKNLNVVSGLCWRYDYGMRATFNEIHNGGVGDIVAIQATYHTTTLKQFPRQPNWSDMEFQLRNWQHFVWGSGDHNVEQHIHSIDKVLWAMQDKTPIRAAGNGGRQARRGEASGNVYDHFSVVYEFEGGVKAFCSCRQIDGAQSDVSDWVYGTEGVADVFAHKITGKRNWKFKGDRGQMYRTEHKELFAAIRDGKAINNGEYMTNSTMAAIMGRMSAYTGRTLTWEEAWNSREDLTPRWEFGSLPVAPVAIPGVTLFT
jgi:predicted dehydrogenase